MIGHRQGRVHRQIQVGSGRELMGRSQPRSGLNALERNHPNQRSCIDLTDLLWCDGSQCIHGPCDDVENGCLGPDRVARLLNFGFCGDRLGGRDRDPRPGVQGSRGCF